MQTAAAATWLLCLEWTQCQFNILASFVFVAAVLILPWSVRCTCSLTCLQALRWIFPLCSRASLTHYFLMLTNWPACYTWHDRRWSTFSPGTYLSTLYYLTSLKMPSSTHRWYLRDLLLTHRLYMNFVELILKKNQRKSLWISREADKSLSRLSIIRG